MRLEAGETLDSAGDRWTGGIEWSDAWEKLVRHWWRFHPTEPILIHRASGEQVVYVGAMEEVSWHRFEYREGEIQYPIAVQMKRVWWPNPRVGQRAGPRGDEREPDELALHVWRVDHLRSADLWRSQTARNSEGAQPPYWLWRRVDHAIADAALLWPRKLGSDIVAAREVAINGGWLNGLWRENFFRRLRRTDNFDAWEHLGAFGLPLTDHYVDDIGARPPRWERVSASGVDLYGVKTFRQTALRNEIEHASIVATSGSLVHLERLPQPALVVLRDDTLWAVPISSDGLSRKPGAVNDPNSLLELSLSWTIRMDRPCSISLGSGNAASLSVPWLRRPISSFDGIGKGVLPAYQASAIDHPLSSYGSWRFLYDCFLNALPFSPGFDERDLESSFMQCDDGQIKIIGGFVGGTLGLVTEIRLKCDLSSESPNANWSRHFS